MLIMLHDFALQVLRKSEVMGFCAGIKYCYVWGEGVGALQRLVGADVN